MEETKRLYCKAEALLLQNDAINLSPRCSVCRGLHGSAFYPHFRVNRIALYLDPTGMSGRRDMVPNGPLFSNWVFLFYAN